MHRSLVDNPIEDDARGDPWCVRRATPREPWIRYEAGTLSLADGRARAAALAAALPSGPAALNLCERRENFLIAFLALLMRGQACLLPPSRAASVIADVMQQHPGCYSIDDEIVARHRVSSTDNAPVEYLQVPADRVVVIGYTSGSTGRPRANPKTWRSLVASTRLNCQSLQEALHPASAMPWILATVPSQHMYGLETAVLMPLLGEIGVHAGHPLFPADIAAALWNLPAPRVLVTTPVHLRALLQSGINLPPLGAVVSATAPLASDLAETIERRHDTRVLEFFGSTETCVIASRSTAREAAWRLYPGVELRPDEEGTRVSAPWFEDDVLLQDVVELQDDGRFVVRGRNADMVEVGGKRASLADLTLRLLSIEGVLDAVVFQTEPDPTAPVCRLAALVVTNGCAEAELLARLAPLMDPVFIPRPLVRVERLPRNEVGKLPRQQLLAALKR